ncbi:MAG: hypothetical protein KJ072_03860 [Verrucomicrobia bacterium]|nr:hypothetical protein [Verrucomicrobiota bacterium]
MLDTASTVVAVLPERKLAQLTGRAIVPWSWDPSSHPSGDYELRALVKGPNDLILDRERTEFRVGQAGGGIVGFEVLPPDYRPGDNVVLRATFDNTGNTRLDGSLVVLVQDAAGTGVTEFRRQFGAVPAGGSFTFDAEWAAASLHPRNCQFLVYAEFGGQTTALRTVADWSTAPLAWGNGSTWHRGWWSWSGGVWRAGVMPSSSLPSWG